MVIALIAKQFGLIPPEIFSALVVMTIVTTFTFPFALARGIKRNPRLMEGWRALLNACTHALQPRMFLRSRPRFKLSGYFLSELFAFSKLSFHDWALHALNLYR